MNETERTTIRIKKKLLQQSRDIAYEKGISLQEAINLILENGLRSISDTDLQQIRDAFEHMDILRDEIAEEYGSDFDEIIKKSKRERK